jgi:hypothetical protein
MIIKDDSSLKTQEEREKRKRTRRDTVCGGVGCVGHCVKMWGQKNNPGLKALGAVPTYPSVTGYV